MFLFLPAPAWYQCSNEVAKVFKSAQPIHCSVRHQGYKALRTCSLLAAQLQHPSPKLGCARARWQGICHPGLGVPGAEAAVECAWAALKKCSYPQLPAEQRGRFGAQAEHWQSFPETYN